MQADQVCHFIYFSVRFFYLKTFFVCVQYEVIPSIVLSFACSIVSVEVKLVWVLIKQFSVENINHLKKKKKVLR